MVGISFFTLYPEVISNFVGLFLGWSKRIFSFLSVMCLFIEYLRLLRLRDISDQCGDSCVSLCVCVFFPIFDAALGFISCGFFWLVTLFK